MSTTCPPHDYVVLADGGAVCNICEKRLPPTQPQAPPQAGKYLFPMMMCVFCYINSFFQIYTLQFYYESTDTKNLLQQVRIDVCCIAKELTNFTTAFSSAFLSHQ